MRVNESMNLKEWLEDHDFAWGKGHGKNEAIQYKLGHTVEVRPHRTNEAIQYKWGHDFQRIFNSLQQGNQKHLQVHSKGAVYIQIIRSSQSLCAITEAHDAPRNFWIL